MASGFAALDEQIRRIRELGVLAERAAPSVASAVKREISKAIAMGVGPDGKPWKPTKAGERPLRNAASSLSVRALKSVVIVRLTGRHARHHLGAVKGGVKRPIIPSARIPAPMVKAIRRVITGEFEEVMS